MKKIEIGIITMHKVLNYGSALQVYGLYETIKNMGCDPVIIDYKFPNEYQFTRWRKKTIIKKLFQPNLIRIIRNKIRLYKKDIWREQKHKFELFYKKYLRFTQQYNCRKDILTTPPKCDIIVTGSDQVWNPKHTCGDPTFFCDFANHIPCISYGSSFACSKISNYYMVTYKKLLNKYKAISVREKTGIEIMKSMDIDYAQIVCDPSLLLNQNKYDELIKDVKIDIRDPYILAYILDYNFNPHPTIDNLINKISKELGFKVIYLECGNIQGNNRNNNEMIFDAGPKEFLWLIKNSKLVITSSFHGAALSILYQKDFYAVKDKDDSDDRLSSLCNLLSLESRLIKRGDTIKDIKTESINWVMPTKKLNYFREYSLNYLQSSITKCLNKE